MVKRLFFGMGAVDRSACPVSPLCFLCHNLLRRMQAGLLDHHVAGRLWRNAATSSASTIVQRFHFRATSSPDLIAA
jgi:hypothetical protein